MTNKKTKICHLTSVHPPFDIRIFYKECVSLANNGFNVTLIAPIEKPITKQGVTVFPIVLPTGRLKRMLVVTFKMLGLALQQKAKIYHFHDPELMLCGIILSLVGKKVVFDIHENISISLISKDWLPKSLRKIVSMIYLLFEKISLLFYNELVLAEQSYLNQYSKNKSTIVLNYPIANNLNYEQTDYSYPIKFIYSGVVHSLRGIWEMLEVIKELVDHGYNVYLDLVGEVRPFKLNTELELYIMQNKLESRINIFGKVDFSEITSFLNKADIGISLLQPIPNYKESLPTKIFEYMQHGLPVITNNFELLKTYVEKESTGICIDYNNIESGVSEIIKLINDKARMKQMSENGIRLTQEQWNWHSQESKLIELYNSMLKVK